MKSNGKRGLMLILVWMLFAAGAPVEASAAKTELTAVREFDPFAWDSYEVSMFSLFSVFGYEDSYGNELSTEQKQIYDQLEAHYLDDEGNFSSGELSALSYMYPEPYIAETEEDYTALKEELWLDSGYAYWAFVYDHPEVYWAGKVSMGLMGSQGSYYKVTGMRFTISEKYAGAQSELSAYQTGVKEAVAAVGNAAVSGDRADILRAIHDYLCGLLSYNYDAVSGSNTDNEAYKYVFSNGAVFTGRTSVVCQAYAEAFKVLADQFEIPCADIIGTARSESHMWNYVQMEDGNWYAVDCTWDDRTPVSYIYFLCGAQSAGLQGTFREEHVEKPCFSENERITFIYPVLSETAYENKEPDVCAHTDFVWETVKEPDCVTDGIRVKRCNDCGEIVDTESIPATKNLSDGCTLQISGNDWTYTGSAIQPKVTVLCGEQAMDVSSYQVVYTDNAGAGTARVTVTGRNGFQGTLTASFVIRKGDSALRLTGKTAVYSGSAVEIPAAERFGSSGRITYTYYTDAGCTTKTSVSVHGAQSEGAPPRNAGTYYVKAQLAGDGNYNGAVSNTAALVIEKATPTVKLKSKTAAYTGKAISINKAVVTGSSGAVTYTYYTNAKCTVKTSKSANGASGSGKAPKYPGTYYVRASVAGDANVSAVKSGAVKLTIKPGKTTISSVKNVSGKKFTVKWPKKTGAGTTSGIKYVVEYTTDKKFKSGIKRVTVSGSKTSCTVSGLKKGKRYYIRIRAYSSKLKLYGEASKIRAVKITK